MIGLDVKYWWVDINRRILNTCRNSCRIANFVYRLSPYELAWDRTAKPWVKGRRLRVWTMNIIKLMFLELLQNESEKEI